MADISTETQEFRATYRAAALRLAEAASGLAEALNNDSDEMIDCRFALVRVAYARCKGAHAAFLMESDTTPVSATVSPSDSSADHVRTAVDLMALSFERSLNSPVNNNVR